MADSYASYGGFYAPGSISGQYVASKRNEEGSYVYDKAAQDIGMQKQAALQNLSENYGNIVNNAYTSYLANQRGIGASQMGQGYKEAYIQQQQANLQQQIQEAGTSTAQARQELEQSAAAGQEAIYQQYLQQVNNLDRADQALKNYFNYLNSYGYFNQDAFKERHPEYYDKYDEQGHLADDSMYREIYQDLLEAQPQSWKINNQAVTDEEGNLLQTFSDYAGSTAGTKQEDTDWLNWLRYQGGMQDYIKALAKSYKEPSQEKLEKGQLNKAMQTTGIVLTDENGNSKKVDKIKPLSSSANWSHRDLSRQTTRYIQIGSERYKPYAVDTGPSVNSQPYEIVKWKDNYYVKDRLGAWYQIVDYKE